MTDFSKNSLEGQHVDEDGIIISIYRNDLDVSALFQESCIRISKGMKPGAYAKLKEQHPERLARVEKELEENFTPDGIVNYERKIVKGFKEIRYWKLDLST